MFLHLQDSGGLSGRICDKRVERERRGERAGEEFGRGKACDANHSVNVKQLCLPAEYISETLQ